MPIRTACECVVNEAQTTMRLCDSSGRLGETSMGMQSAVFVDDCGSDVRRPPRATRLDLRLMRSALVIACAGPARGVPRASRTREIRWRQAGPKARRPSGTLIRKVVRQRGR